MVEEIDEARYREEIKKNEYTIIYYGSEVWQEGWRRMRVFVDDLADKYKVFQNELSKKYKTTR